MIRAQHLFIFALVLFFSTTASKGEDPVSFKIDIQRDGDASSSFNCTVVINLVEQGVIRTLRIPDPLGKLVDSLHINESQHELSVDRSRIFKEGDRVSKFKLFVISSRHMPAEFSTWMTSDDDQLLVRALIESRESYRARADGVRPLLFQPRARAGRRPVQPRAPRACLVQQGSPARPSPVRHGPGRTVGCVWARHRAGAGASSTYAPDRCARVPRERVQPASQAA